MILLKGFVISTVEKVDGGYWVLDCIVENGDGQNWVLDYEDGVSDHQKAVAYYEKGLECRSQGQNKSAAFSSLQAYALHAGWEAVDQELDALHRRFKADDWGNGNLNWRLRDWNVKGILQGFQYKTERQTT